MPITKEQAALVKASVPALQAHGLEVTKIFYDNLLLKNPSLKNIFNEANQVHLHQPKALAHAVMMYAAHLDDLSALGSTVDLITSKHASMYVRPEQYAIVGKHLLEAMQEVLGEALTPELLEAWTAAYSQLADIFCKKEEALYKEAQGWSDWREFRIEKKIKESEEITSFYLKPVDEGELPLFKPGQYISIQVDVPILGHMQVRQYSLSDAPWPDYYRVSIKREAGLDVKNPDSTAHPGLVSNIMHDLKEEGDVVNVSHPQGDFFLEASHAAEEWPVVLISGGVGLTSLTSILNALVVRHSSRPISWIHSARTADVRAFGSHIKEIQRARKNVKAIFVDAKPKPDHVLGKDYQHAGRLDLSKLDKEKELFVHDPKAHYYICGPTQFMVDMENALKNYGVEASRIRMELFGTGGVPRDVST